MKDYELRVDEAAKILRVHRSTIYRAIKRGEFPASRWVNGFDWTIRRSDLDEWIRRGGGKEPIVLVTKKDLS